eukprot:tig00020927_g15994.t1
MTLPRASKRRVTASDAQEMNEGEKRAALESWYNTQHRKIEVAEAEYRSKIEQELLAQRAFRTITPQEERTRLMKVENAFKTVRAELERKYLEGLKVIQKPKKVGKRSNLPKSGVQILKQWLFDHFLHPYPTEEEKVQLAAQTNLGVQQVNNWFINARVRIWKPLVEQSHRERQQGAGIEGTAAEPLSETSTAAMGEVDPASSDDSGDGMEEGSDDDFDAEPGGSSGTVSASRVSAIAAAAAAAAAGHASLEGVLPVALAAAGQVTSGHAPVFSFTGPEALFDSSFTDQR